jgi:hypothetical protein
MFIQRRGRQEHHDCSLTLAVCLQLLLSGPAVGNVFLNAFPEFELTEDAQAGHAREDLEIAKAVVQG